MRSGCTARVSDNVLNVDTESEARLSYVRDAKRRMTKTTKRFFIVNLFHVLLIPLTTMLDSHVYVLI